MINLFCIPHAGGSAYVYYGWRRYVHNTISLYPVELSGRGRRMKEPAYTCFSEAVNDVYNDIKEKIQEGPYAILGHSMGSTLAYELTYKIISDNLPLPEHIIFSGRLPPEYNHLFGNIHDKSDMEFQKEIIKLGGTSDEIFNNNELCDIFLPVLRTDYTILENYSHAEKAGKFPVNISVFIGTKDSPKYHYLMEHWATHTEKACEFYYFNGNHFFITEQAKEVVEVINRILVKA